MKPPPPLTLQLDSPSIDTFLFSPGNMNVQQAASGGSRCGGGFLAVRSAAMWRARNTRIIKAVPAWKRDSTLQPKQPSVAPPAAVAHDGPTSSGNQPDGNNRQTWVRYVHAVVHKDYAVGYLLLAMLGKGATALWVLLEVLGYVTANNPNLAPRAAPSSGPALGRLLHDMAAPDTFVSQLGATVVLPSEQELKDLLHHPSRINKPGAKIGSSSRSASTSTSRGSRYVGTAAGTEGIGGWSDLRSRSQQPAEPLVTVSGATAAASEAGALVEASPDGLGRGTRGVDGGMPSGGGDGGSGGDGDGGGGPGGSGGSGGGGGSGDDAADGEGDRDGEAPERSEGSQVPLWLSVALCVSLVVPPNGLVELVLRLTRQLLSHHARLTERHGPRLARRIARRAGVTRQQHASVQTLLSGTCGRAHLPLPLLLMDPTESAATYELMQQIEALLKTLQPAEQPAIGVGTEGEDPAQGVTVALLNAQLARLAAALEEVREREARLAARLLVRRAMGAVLNDEKVSSLSHALDMSSMALSSSQRRMAELTASMEELQAQWDAELALAERHVTHLAEERDALAAEVEELLSAKEDAEAHAAELHGKVLEREMRARRAEDERDQERGGREALAAQLRQADKAVLELQDLLPDTAPARDTGAAPHEPVGPSTPRGAPPDGCSAHSSPNASPPLLRRLRSAAAHVQAMADSVAQLQGEREALARELQQQTADRDAAAAALCQVQAEAAAQRSEISALEMQLAQAASAREELEGELLAARCQLCELQEQLAASEVQLQDARQSHAAAVQDLDGARQQLKGAAEAASVAQAAHRATLEELQAARAEAAAAEACFAQQLDTEQRELAVARSHLLHANHHVAEALAEKGVLRQQLKAALAQLQEAQAAAEAEAAKRKEAEEAAAALHRQVAARQEELQRLAGLLQAGQHGAEEAQGLLVTQRDEAMCGQQQLQQQLVELQGRLAAVQEEQQQVEERAAELGARAAALAERVAELEGALAEGNAVEQQLRATLGGAEAALADAVAATEASRRQEAAHANSFAAALASAAELQALVDSLRGELDAASAQRQAEATAAEVAQQRLASQLAKRDAVVSQLQSSVDGLLSDLSRQRDAVLEDARAQEALCSQLAAAYGTLKQHLEEMQAAAVLDRQKHQAQVEDLRAQLQVASRSVEELQEQLVGAEAARCQLQMELQALRSDRDLQQAASADATTELESKLAGAEGALRELQAQLVAAETSRAELLSQLAAGDSSQQGLQAQLQEALGSGAQLQVRLAEAEGARAELQARLAAAEAAHRDLQEQLSAGERAHKALRAQFAAAEDATVEQLCRADAAEDAVAQLRRELTAVEGVRGELQARLGEAESEREGLREQLAAAEAAAADLTAQLASAEGSQSELQMRLAEVEGEKGDLQQRLAAADGTAEELHTQLAEAEASRLELCSQVAAADAAREDALARLAEAEAARSQLQQQLHTAQEEQEQALQRLAAAEASGAELGEQLVTAEASRVELQHRATTAETSSAQLSDKLASAEASKAELQQELAALGASHAQLLQQVAAGDSARGDLQARAASDERARAELQAQLAAAVASRAEVQEKLAASLGDRDALDQRLQASERAYRELEARLRAADDGQEQLQQQLAAAAAARTVAERELAAAQDAASELQQQLAGQQASRAQLQDALQDAEAHGLLREQLAAAEAQHEAHGSRLADLQQQLQNAKGAASQLQSRLAAAEGRCSELQAQLGSARGDCEALQEQLAAAQAAKQDLAAQLEALEAQRGDLQRQHGQMAERLAAVQGQLARQDAAVIRRMTNTTFVQAQLEDMRCRQAASDAYLVRHTVRAALTRAALRAELDERDAQIAGLRRQLHQLAASWDHLAGCSPAARWPGAGGEDDFAFGGLPMPPSGWRPSWPTADTPSSTGGRRLSGGYWMGGFPAEANPIEGNPVPLHLREGSVFARWFSGAIAEGPSVPFSTPATANRHHGSLVPRLSIPQHPLQYQEYVPAEQGQERSAREAISPVQSPTSRSRKGMSLQERLAHVQATAGRATARLGRVETRLAAAADIPAHHLAESVVARMQAEGKPLLPGIGRYGPQQSGTASESARSSQQDPGAGLGSAEAHRVGAGTGSAVGSGLGTNLGGSANPCCPATGHYLTHQYHSPDYQAAQQEQQWQKAVQREAKPQCRQGLLLLVPSTSGPLADEEGAQLTPTDMGALTSCVQALRSGLEQLMAGMVEPPENPCRSPAAQPGAGEAGEGGVPPSAAAAKGPTDALHTPEQEQQQQRALVLALMQHVQQLERHLLPSARTPSQDSVELSGTAAAPGTVTPGEALGANHDGARPTGDAASLMDVDNPRDIHSSMVLLGTPLNMSVQDGVLPPFPAHTHVPQPTEVSGRAMQCDAVGEERAGSADGDAGAGKVSPVKPSEEGAGTPGRRVASIHAVTYDSSSAGGSSTTVAEATAPATSKHTPFADTANAAAAPEAGAGAEPVGQHPSPAPAHTQPAEQGMATPDKTSPHRHRHHMSPQDRAALRRLASHSPLAVGAGALRLPRAATLPSASGMSDGSSVLASPGALPPTGTVPSRSPGAAAAAGPVDRTSFGNPIDNPLYARTPTASEATAGALLAPTVHTEPHMAERPRHRSPFAGHALRYGDEDGTEEEGQQQHGEQQPGSGELPDIGVSDSLDLGRLRHGMQAPRASAPGALPATNGYPSAAANPLRSSHAGSAVPYGSLAAADGPHDSYKADPRASSLLCLPARKSGKFSFRLPSRQGSRSSAFGGHHDDGCSVASGSSQAASGLGLGLWGSGTASVTASADLSHAVMAASAGGAAAHALHPSAGGGESAATQGPFKAQKKKGVFGRIKRALSGRGSTAEVVPVPAAMVVAAPLAAGAGAEPMGRPPRPV